MNSFFKMFLACLAAIVLSGLGLIFLFFVFVGTMSLMLQPRVQQVHSGSVLKIDFAERIADKPAPLLLRDVSGLRFEIVESMTLLDALGAIREAKTDPAIEGIYLSPTPMMSISLANLDEVREALIDFKKSGKFIVGYADVYTQGSYYAVSVADRIFVNPAGGVLWQGMATNPLYFKGTLDKLGVRAEVIRHGKYKSAVEPFTSGSMSPEDREQTSALLGSVWGHMVGNIARSRDIDSARLQTYATELSLRDAGDAVKYKLVDEAAYGSDAADYIREKLGRDEDPHFVSLREYMTARQAAGRKGGRSDNRIAVIYAEGDIVDGKGDRTQVGGETLSATLADARRDERVKGVVLRVNSPGGSVLASEVIWHEMSLLQQEKPVIVSMGAYAASGGYYISCPADVIVAGPATITGSIGVFGLLFDVRDGLRDKLGIHVETVKTNPSAGVNSAILFEPLTPAQRAFLQYNVERSYDTFVDRVARGRNLTPGQVERIAEGRVWSGVDALRNGLIDGFGGLEQAIALAADRSDAGTDYEVVTYPKRETRLEQLVSLLKGEAEARLSGQSRLASVSADYAAFARYLENASAVQAVVPYRLELRP